jgi:hypothetical protein
VHPRVLLEWPDSQSPSAPWQVDLPQSGRAAVDERLGRKSRRRRGRAI